MLLYRSNVILVSKEEREAERRRLEQLKALVAPVPALALPHPLRFDPLSWPFAEVVVPWKRAAKPLKKV